MPSHSGHPLGNQNPKKRGLDKNIKNLKGNKKSGCPLTIIIFLIMVAGVVSTAVYITSHVV
jgi:hypothetical protein